MKPRLIAVLAVCALLAVGVTVYSMPPLFSPPAPRPAETAWRVGPQNVKLAVVSDPDLKTPRLRIPRSLLVTAAEEPKRVGAAGRVPAIMAGLALSAAFVVGGLWLSGKGNRAVKAAVLVLGLLVLGAGAALADIPSPFGGPRPPRPFPFPLPGERPPAALKLPADVTLPADVQIEIVTEGDALVLAIPGKAGAPGAGAGLGVPATPPGR